MGNKPRILALSHRVYNLLLFAYPAPFRREYGPHMAQLFRDSCRDVRRQSGSAGMVVFWFLTFADLFKTALAEHIWEVFHMPVDKILRWSGPAAILGGALWILLWQIDPTYFPGAFVFILMVLLFLIALGGLYRRLPVGIAKRLSAACIAASSLAMSIGIFGIAGNNNSEVWWTIFVSGFYTLALGLAIIGILTIARRSLSRWSFIPLLLAALLGGVIISGGEYEPNTLQMALIILFGLSWGLLGYVLWATPEDIPDPLLPA